MTKKTKKYKKNYEKKNKLTLKQRKWLLFYMDDGNATRAALFAYYPNFPIDKNFKDLTPEESNDYSNAAVIGYENLRKLNIPIEDLLDEAGLTDVYFTQKLKENMEATRLYGKDAIEGMDGNARNSAWENGMKLKGKLIDRVDHTSLGKSIEAPIIRAKIKPRKNATTQT